MPPLKLTGDSVPSTDSSRINLTRRGSFILFYLIYIGSASNKLGIVNCNWCAVHLNGDAGPVELEWMGVDWAVAELGWVALVEVDMDMRGEPGAGAGAGSCSEDCRRIFGSWLLLVAGVTPPLPAAATLYFSDIFQILFLTITLCVDVTFKYEFEWDALVWRTMRNTTMHAPWKLFS